MSNFSAMLTNVSFVSGDPTGVTIVDVASFCLASDHQAKVVSIVGFVLGIFLLFYFGRFRAWLNLYGYAPLVLFLDKFLLTSNALCFGIIITRLYYAS